MKCKKQTDIRDVVHTTTKNGRNIVKGKCAVCDTKVNKFVSGKSSD